MSALTGPLTIEIHAHAAAEVPAGRGRVVWELLQSLAERDDSHRYVCFARSTWGDLPAISWELVSAHDSLWHIRAVRSDRCSCDVFLSTNSYLTGAVLGKPSASSTT